MPHTPQSKRAAAIAHEATVKKIQRLNMMEPLRDSLLQAAKTGTQLSKSSQKQEMGLEPVRQKKKQPETTSNTSNSSKNTRTTPSKLSKRKESLSKEPATHMKHTRSKAIPSQEAQKKKKPLTSAPSDMHKATRTFESDSKAKTNTKAKPAVDPRVTMPKSPKPSVAHNKERKRAAIGQEKHSAKIATASPPTTTKPTTTTTVEISIQVTLLTGASTFLAWREQMSHILRSQNFWSLVAFDREPTEVNQRIQFIKDSTRLSGLLLHTIEPGLQQELPLAVRMDGKKLWKALGEMFTEGSERQQGEEKKVLSRPKQEATSKRKRGAEELDETSAKRAKKNSATTADKQIDEQPHGAKKQALARDKTQLRVKEKKKQSPQGAKTGAHKARRGYDALAQQKHTGRIAKLCRQNKRARTAAAGAHKGGPQAGYLRATHASAAKGRA